MIDIGVNLLHPQFDGDRQAVVDRARLAGISEMLVTATDLSVTADAIAFCEAADLYCTAGVHPHDAKDAPADLAERLSVLAQSPRVRAIGETGLDFNRNFSPPDIQLAVFRTQLGVASQCQLPVFVHDRESGGVTHDLLGELAEGLPGVVVHCFTGTARELQQYLQLGCYIGITGWICDRRRGAALRSIIHEARGPQLLDRLLIETDAPFLLPHGVAADWHPSNAPGASRRRNEPALLPLVVKQLAELLEVAEDELAAKTASNARALFALPDRQATAQV